MVRSCNGRAQQNKNLGGPWASSSRLMRSMGRAIVDPIVDLTRQDMERVNATILSRTGSDVTMIPEVANHLISSAASACVRC